jgi:hypothetical protein
MNEKITKKETVAFVLIVGAMLSCLVYGYFLIKKENVPAPMSCWDKYKYSSEQVAIQACEEHSNE